MSTVRRPNALSQVLDLTRRLAEEFDSLPIPTVTHAVRQAVSAAQLFGSEVSANLDTIERLAREDLEAMSAATADSARIALAG